MLTKFKRIFKECLEDKQASMFKEVQGFPFEGGTD